MQAYKTVVTITDPQQLILTNLPFRKGQRVEVVLLENESVSSGSVNSRAELQSLFAETQALPHIQNLSDDEIWAEVEQYRAGQ